MRRPTITVLFLLLVTFAFGCGNRVHYEKVDPQGRFVSERYQFCLQTPKDWEVRERVQSSEVVCLSHRSGPDDSFRENLVVGVEPLTETLTSEQYAEKKKAELGTSAEVVESDFSGELPHMTYRHSLDGQSIEVLAYFRSHQVGGAYYGLSFLFSQRAEDFAESRPVFEEAASTFKFGDTECAEMRKLGSYPADLPTPEVTRSPAP
ncbi:MAG: hypothetical protein KC910_22695 [Candidatus Eremiobacteraeota bacterium]|nr:hypothetical protein [Candidatus Eremiobacteraeota bacterium]